MMNRLLLATILLATSLSNDIGHGGGIVVVAAEDAHPQCDEWASTGECSLNPTYMWSNCADACGKLAETEKTMSAEIEKKIANINSFFDLEALDIDKNVVKFDQFKGKVTVITNVASYCGYTESHYTGLVHLHYRFKNSPMGFNILAFPCNQFGNQEPEECPAIKLFAKQKGVEFIMMDKVDVNGLDASPVYHYLKKVAGPPRITWNFATYYLVKPDGTVQSFSGVGPMEMVPHISKAMGIDDEEAKSEF